MDKRAISNRGFWLRLLTATTAVAISAPRRLVYLPLVLGGNQP